MPRLKPRRSASVLLCAVLAVLVMASGAGALTTLFAEDFDGIPLTSSPTYQLPNAWSPNPPPGWDRFDDLPGLNDPSLGVLEFKGWNFWQKPLWQAVAGGARQRFQRGQGVVAVADPDTWNDLGNPSDRGLYNTFLTTPLISLDGVGDNDSRLILGFDTSWRGGCCGTNQDFDNNQTAIVRARIDSGPAFEVLRWESARFRDGQGRPTNNPFDGSGSANTPNPFFMPREFDERVFLDFSDLLTGFSSAHTGPHAPAASGTGGGIQFEFGMEDAGDDGWWAVDNLELSSYGTLLGDMNHNDILDLGDYDAFALGMLDTLAYQYAYGGASPVESGSLDSEFDLDDIPYFLTLMEGVGPPPAMSAFWGAFAPVPEPSAGLLAVLTTLAASGGRRVRARSRL